MNNEQKHALFLEQSKKTIADFHHQIDTLLAERKPMAVRVVVRREDDHRLNDNDILACRSFFKGLEVELSTVIRHAENIYHSAGLLALRSHIEALFQTETRDEPSYLEGLRKCPDYGPECIGVELEMGFRCVGDDVVVDVKVGLDDGSAVQPHIRRPVLITTHYVARRTSPSNTAVGGAHIVMFPNQAPVQPRD